MVYEKEAAFFRELPQELWCEFASRVFEIAEAEYGRLDLAAGVAFGYIDRERVITSKEKLVNPTGRQGWGTDMNIAMERMTSTLYRTANKEYPGVLVFPGEDIVTCLSVSSNDGKGNEEKDGERDRELVRQIVGEVIHLWDL